MGIVVHTCNLLDVYEEELGKPLDYLKEKNSGTLSIKENGILVDEHKLR
jgi:hypothetical protein